MSKQKTVAVKLNIGELTAVIEWCHKIANSIPLEDYRTVNMAGSTMGEVVQKYRKRAYELNNILDEKWPK